VEIRVTRQRHQPQKQLRLQVERPPLGRLDRLARENARNAGRQAKDTASERGFDLEK
jgi:hypothetical protein